MKFSLLLAVGLTVVLADDEPETVAVTQGRTKSNPKDASGNTRFLAISPGVGPGVAPVSPAGFGGGFSLGPGLGASFGAVSPGFGGVLPGFGGGFGVTPGFGGGFNVNTGFRPVAPPSACRYWCRTPQGQAYCCENLFQQQSFAGVVKPGFCPPVRPVCPPVRNFQPPASCSNDGGCGGVDKCCFDTCLQQHVCKPPQGIGR